MRQLARLFPTRSARVLLLLLVLLGGAFTLANRGLPLVRNSLVYARASESVLAHGYDPRPVVADSRLSYDKPILYPWFSAPFVRALGNHDGLRLTSFLTSAAYLLALMHFARSFRAGLPAGGELGVLWFGALGPCVVYQFWSAHPDGWFAALAVLAWSLTQRLVTGELGAVRGTLALGATILVAMLLKNYGLVLLGSCPLYLVWHLRALRADRERFRKLAATSAAVFGLIAVFVALAWTGHNPLSRLEGEGGGVGQYATGELARSARGTWVALGLALLVQFQLALALLFRKSAWSRTWLAPLACFGAPYVLGLMPFPTTFYNMRYFVPLFALVGLPVVRACAALAPALRHALLLAHGALGLGLILLFNSGPLYRRAAQYVPTLEVNWIGVPLSLLDNLRMPLHLEQADVLAHIDAEVPPGATLYFLDVSYYRDAQQGVYERAGLIRPDITTVYAASKDCAPDVSDFFVYSQRPVSLEPLGHVTDLGHGLCHVESP